MNIAVSKERVVPHCYHKAHKGGRPCGPEKTRADALALSLRLRFLSPGGCLTVFSLCFLLLILLCCSCFSGFLSIKVNVMNIMMATSGSPALPGRQPHCANRLCR
ncbi:hypothetical protein [Pantoea agglomerans]|uniref:hypothetical protein n=1 Tax=Enterobacter agglomerans TaxID=549 RepID=UPI00289F3A92|nr:hypothetical protein [Pantoea agglomerans]WNK42252.1 hypothetical protein RM160_21985 [Pantoea agglomerans]